MGIRIIAEGLKNTSHAVFNAREIAKDKPDAVFLELPEHPFQKILDHYSEGKLNTADFKTVMFAALRKQERKVDHNLTKKLLEKEIAHEELEDMESEGREIHMIHVAKAVGAKIIAMDVDTESIIHHIKEDFKAEHLENTRLHLHARQVPLIVWRMSELLHFPFYVIERLVHHHALRTVSPFKHNSSTCKMCRLGAKWDKLTHRIVMPLFAAMPLSKGLKIELKVGYIMGEIDELKEKHMAAKIGRVYYQLQQKLGREPNVIVVTHLIKAHELDSLIEEAYIWQKKK